ncbi:MAG: molybdopterin molybdotransferase MoeA [Chloroflexi bacterium]|nr:molybdopterin molybdotransferase MoeA [Chloroflexota bacterium]
MTTNAHRSHGQSELALNDTPNQDNGHQHGNDREQAAHDDCGHSHCGEARFSVEEALERILRHFQPLEAVRVPLLEALGQVLSEDALASHDIPPLDNSAMDGYALQAADLQNASADNPIKLHVSGIIAAGDMPTIEVTQGNAVRIMTGAPVPDGADAVVPFEVTDEMDRRASGTTLSEIGVHYQAAVGDHIRPAGQDVRNGEIVLPVGTMLRPSEIGVLASLGHDAVSVLRRPVVAILATGNELLEPGAPYSPGMIYDSNTYSVAATVLRFGGVPKLIGIARDNLESMNASLRAGLDSDMMVTSAGVSNGDYDMVKDVLAQHGEIDFWSVRMRPAKPLAFGVLNADEGRKVPLLGLPGNPVSAIVAFEQFGRAAIRRMLGKPDMPKPTISAVLDEPIYNGDDRRVYARAVIRRENGVYRASLTGEQGSNLLTSMARANGLAICPENIPVKKQGETVQVQMLDWTEDTF